MKILVTGVAGFVGFHSAKRLLDYGHEIIGIDNLNNYYDPKLKISRLDQLSGRENFTFIKLDIADREGMRELFLLNQFEVVLHLAAQAGVRYSIDNPFAYVDSNLTGTLTVLEGCRHSKVRHLVYASSSSVYGANTKQPFSIDDRVDNPVSLYAATKKSNELMCETYTHLYGFAATGMRFFTVYGPYGRPDMAYFKFADSIVNGRTIDIYNHGDMKRDFTFIDDIVEGILSIVSDGNRNFNSGRLHRVYNLGNNRPEQLLHMIELLEENLGRKAIKRFLPIQPGDVKETFADIDLSVSEINYKPSTTLGDGIKYFCEWFKRYYRIN